MFVTQLVICKVIAISVSQAEAHSQMVGQPDLHVNVCMSISKLFAWSLNDPCFGGFDP